jgi:hypothetical protein
MATEHDDLDPRLAAAIRGLEDRGPDVDLWPGIARRIAPRRRGTLQLRWPVAVAAALALVAGSAAITSALLPGRGAPAPATSVAAGSPGGTVVLPARYGEAEQSLASAIDRLEEAYAAAAPKLDAGTRDQIKSSLAALDSAIAEARRRADSAPTDLRAAKYLTRTMQRKLDVLQTVATMTTQS